MGVTFPTFALPSPLVWKLLTLNHTLQSLCSFAVCLSPTCTNGSHGALLIFVLFMIPAEGTMQNGHLINILALQSTSTYWYLISDLVSNTQCSGSPQICRLPSFPCYTLISLNVLKSKQALHYFQRAERPASWSCYQNQTGGGGGETLGLVTKFCLGPIPDSNPPMLLSGSSTSLIQGSLLFTLPGVGLPVW